MDVVILVRIQIPTPENFISFSKGKAKWFLTWAFLDRCHFYKQTVNRKKERI